MTPDGYGVRGRALTPDAKRDVIDRLYAAWLRDPMQRLGQLIVNYGSESRLFHVEDRELVERIERRVTQGLCPKLAAALDAELRKARK